MAPVTAATTTSPSMYLSSSTSAIAPSLYLPATTTAPTVVKQGSFVAAAPPLITSTSSIVVSKPGTVSYPAPYGAPLPVVSATPVPRLVAKPAPAPVGVPGPVPVIKASTPMPSAGEPLLTGRSFTVPAPRKKTEGFPDPDTIAKQKEGYSKSLEMQLQQGSDAVIAQGKAQKEMIEQNCKQQLAECQLQIETQMKLSSCHIDHQVQAMLMALQEAALQQKTLLEEKAAFATRDYEKRRALDEASMRVYQVQKEKFEGEMKLLTELQKVRTKTV